MEALTTRVAIAGTESSHVDHFVRHLNVEGRHPGVRVTVLSGGDAQRNRELAALGDIDTLVDSPAMAADLVDAAIVSDRDGTLHRTTAEPFLAAGLPVLVDKPLAASTRDAEAILDSADRHRGLVTSFSALRFAPDLDELRRRLDGRGPLRTLTVTGPADPASPHAGLWFYGIHLVELAFELLGAVEPGPVEVDRTPGCIVAATRLGDVGVRLNFVGPDDGGTVPFQVAATDPRGTVAGTIGLDNDYCAPGLDRFVAMLRTRRPMYDRASLLRPVRLMESIVSASGR